MQTLHPGKPLRGLNLHHRREFVGMVECRGLDVYLPRKNGGVPVKQSRTAVRTKAAQSGSRRVDRFRSSFGQRQRSFLKHRPRHQRCARTSPAVTAMANRNRRRFTRELILNCAAIASSVASHPGKVSSIQSEGGAYCATSAESSRCRRSSSARFSSISRRRWVMLSTSIATTPRPRRSPSEWAIVHCMQI